MTAAPGRATRHPLPPAPSPPGAAQGHGRGHQNTNPGPQLCLATPGSAGAGASASCVTRILCVGKPLEVQEEGSGWGHGKQGQLGEPPLVNKQLAPTATPQVRPSACLGGAFLRAPSLCLRLGVRPGAPLPLLSAPPPPGLGGGVRGTLFPGAFNGGRVTRVPQKRGCRAVSGKPLLFPRRPGRRQGRWPADPRPPLVPCARLSPHPTEPASPPPPPGA